MSIDVAATQHQLLLGYQPELEIDEPEVGLERFQPRRFDVKYSLFRVGHFTNRIVELDDKIELPNGSILHVFDNISHPDDVIDTPRVDENIFLVNESFRKFIYHVTDFNFNHIQVKERYIYRNAGIVTSLSRFRAEQGSEFKYLTDISSPDVPATSLVVVNHNPLFRAKVFGKLKYYRRINLILSSIFNTAADMASSWDDRRQYIVIPWNDEVYGKEKFLRTRYKLNPQTILYPESFQYIFMMHLVNYMWNDSTTSLFSKLSDEALSHINLVIQANDRALIFNMHTIRELNEKNRYFIKFTNQLNVLASTHHLNDESVPDEYKEKIRHALSITADDDTDGPAQIEITESDVAVPKKQTKPATQDDNDSEVIRDNDDIAVNGMVPVTEVSPNASPISKLTKVGDFIRTAMGEHSSKEAEPRVQGAVAQAKAPTKTTSTKPTKIVTAVDDTIITRNLELDSTMQFIDETMSATDEFIDNHENLSPKAKAKMKTIARSYQKLKLDGVPVTKILQENGSVVIDPNETKVDTDVGIVPDDGARSSTLSSFDDKYIKHTSKKHIVSTLLSFQKCGVFLTDLDTEDKVDEMNHQRTYVARFTDINDKRSTVKFTMPVVESDNRIKVDGVRQVMKKQRINLPIVKISDMEVSLATNQNKTRVIRNTTQAHSFYSKVEDIVKSEEAFDVIYGSLTINKYISYEYATIARHIRSINWLTKDKISVSLEFAYPNRHEHAEMSEEDLHELEAVYGSIYVGRYGTSKLFINVDSKLLAVTSDGKEDPEFMYDSLLDLMYNSIETKKKLNLTEWVSIKILDKMLPVIFVTAYRYGLRGALDTLGIKYTITEPRTKAIIGGTNIAAPATENIQVTSTDDAIEVIDETDAWRHDISARSPEDFGDMEWLDANDLISDIDDPTEVSDLPAMSRREAICPSMEKFEDKTLSNTGHAALMSLIAPIRSTKYGFMFHGSRLDPEHVQEFMDAVNESMAIGTESVTTTATGTMKYTPKSTDIAIKLADATIWFDRYPLKHSLVAAGLDEYNLRNFSLADMETKDAYYDLLTTSGMSINYLRGIDSFFDLFIDPITHNVLVSMQMPTTVIGLLYKSAEMLATLEHRNPSSRFNHRIRGYEQFNAILYNEMARQFAKYQAQRNKGNTFSINPDAVYLRIIQNASMVPSDAVNPIQDMKDKASMTYSGVGGRTSESFVIEDRKFSKDDIGVISEATVDNGKVGIAAQLSYNPALGNTLGVLNPNDVSELDPADCLSVTSLVFPFAMNDDTKRANFINIQCTHMMPTKRVDQSRVRTGYERLLGHQVSRDYVGVASQDGIVTVVDEEAGMVEVKYKDGNRDVFRIGHTYNEFENFEVDEHLVPVVKLGQKVKKNDIICYNRGFFNYDPITGQTDFSIGIRANVALMETDQTLEDSVAISKRLSDAMTLYPIQTKYITLNRKSLVMDAKSVGEHVKVNDFLMIFDEDPIDGQEEAMSNVDATTVAMLGELSRRTPRAGYEGKIINIDAYTGCKVSEMSPSVAKLFKKAIATKQARANIAKGSVRDTEFVPSTIIPEGSKYKGVTFDKDTVVFVYRIQEALPQDKGDKMVVANQLKCTVAGVFTKPTMTAGGEEIDVIFSPCGICRRICMSPFITGVLSKTMEKVQDEFVAIARGKK